MQELWVCERCKSINRRDARRCYSCGQGRPQQAQVLRDTARPEAQPVLTPGLDDEHFEVAWTLRARHGFVSAWRLGYAAAALLAVGLGLIVATTAVTLLTGLIQISGGTPPSIPDNVVATAALLYGAFWLGLIVCHSIFLGLATYDVPALGGGSPRFAPLRAGLWWVESVLWAVLAWLVVNWPLAVFIGIFIIGELIYTFGLILGLILVLIVGAWLARQSLNPFGWLTKPQWLLRDLYARLAVPGDEDDRVITYFVMGWALDVGGIVLLTAILWVTLLGLILLGVVAAGSGTRLELNPEGAPEFVTILANAVSLVALIAQAVWVALLAWITLSIARRLKVREAWFNASAAGAAGAAGGLQIQMAAASGGSPAGALAVAGVSGAGPAGAAPQPAAPGGPAEAAPGGRATPDGAAAGPVTATDGAAEAPSQPPTVPGPRPLPPYVRPAQSPILPPVARPQVPPAPAEPDPDPTSDPTSEPRSEP